MTFALALMAAGVVLTVAGWYGPEDKGLLAAIGFIILGFGICKGVMIAGLPWRVGT